MNILITGANGYIGKSLSNAFSKKYKLTLLTRDSVDLCDYIQVKKFFSNKYFDVVIHCAVVGGSRLQKDDWGVLDKNLIMFYNLLKFESHYKKFIHFGSGAEDYLDNEPYGFSKKVISKSIKNKKKFYTLKVFAVFDENELSTRFIKTNIIKYLKKEPITIFQNKLMDFFYMKDLITLVNYYINNSELEREIECVYSEKLYLTNIAEKINQCDNYRVNIEIQTIKMAEQYIGKCMDLYQINFLGIDQGINETYRKLKETEFF